MDSKETINEYFSKVLAPTNQMKANGEKMSDLSIVEKILRTLSVKFDHIVVAIEESKNLTELSIDELQGSLEAHEQRLLERNTERNTEKSLEQVYQAQMQSKFDKPSENVWKGRKPWVRGRGRGRGNNQGGRSYKNPKEIIEKDENSHDSQSGNKKW